MLAPGYAIAPANLIQQMAPYCDPMNVNVLAKWAGATALKDTAALETTKKSIIQTRKKTAAALEGMGFAVVPSETNFFMVNLRRDVRPVIQAFRRDGVSGGPAIPTDGRIFACQRRHRTRDGAVHVGVQDHHEGVIQFAPRRSLSCENFNTAIR